MTGPIAALLRLQRVGGAVVAVGEAQEHRHLERRGQVAAGIGEPQRPATGDVAVLDHLLGLRSWPPAAPRRRPPARTAVAGARRAGRRGSIRASRRAANATPAVATSVSAPQIRRRRSPRRRRCRRSLPGPHRDAQGGGHRRVDRGDQLPTVLEAPGRDVEVRRVVPDQHAPAVVPGEDRGAAGDVDGPVGAGRRAGRGSTGRARRPPPRRRTRRRDGGRRPAPVRPCRARVRG